MTIAELQAVFDGISFPGVTFTVRRRRRTANAFGMVKADVYVATTDTRDRSYNVTIRRTFEIMPMRMTEKDALDVAFQEIVRHLAHEAAERFRYRDALVFDPHLYGEPERTPAPPSRHPARAAAHRSRINGLHPKQTGCP